ncbi:MAG: N-6 DNA methylase [Prolixibacteraceae bacterium]|nr:N-6 DNA methylase [Prolixibacteraceae bacterium]
MSLFQKSVEKKYLNDLNSELIEKKYADFQNYFGNPERQENIRNSKEEQFQEGFLRELFVKILGYTLNPEPNFNLTTELKNIANSKKADGAILKGEDATAVIELKGTNTTDLDKIETQAFGYKNHHPKCKYVITSNFEKLRFYIQNAVDHVDFDLFNLSKEQLSLLWLCLAKDNLLTDLPLKIKESSVLQEENITKKLYADYSKFREAIFNNLVKNNPETDKLLLFKKTQKLLDRFLFIFFAEDRLLVPPNSISQIIEKWKDDVDFGDAKPLYYTFKKYFHVLNVGRPKSGNRQEIYAYNGGLFKPDEILDNITIDDEILHEYTLRLSNYDFETDVDVNILGHIFEHSLGEIENVQAEIKGEKIDTQKTKRKKDGIFYTPKYITKYIVENTVGKLCEEKRSELDIVDEEYAKGRRKRKKDTVKTLDNKLTEYRNWLLSLTILDPACGSGAFLNQALDFLITEHRKIDDLRAQLLGGSIVFSDITTDILEKNIYGVDLNEESVEIAKLSLWLRTAQKGRKLNKLNNNIKCGNSLIDDPEVAGEKAFNWQNEFPNIFQKKNKKLWHVTTATHNSRYSQRMFDNFVKTDSPVWLSDTEEVIVTETIAEIAKEDKLNILAYNICGDHAHLVLVGEENELPKIVQKIKSVSARACNIAMGRTIPVAGTRGHAPLSGEPDTGSTGEHAPQETRGETQFHLWTQKFGKNEINSDEQLENAIAYIQNNRKKHQLPENKKVQKLAKEMCSSRAYAFRTEYKGGFDVVIGNPPYVRSRGLMKDKEKNYFTSIYKTASYQLDLYKLFIEKSLNLINKKGLLSFITPSVFLSNDYDKPLRKFILDNYSLSFVATSDEDIFADASVKTVVFSIKINDTKKTIDFFKIDKGEFHHLKSIEKQVFIKQNYTINENMNLQSINIVSKLSQCKLLNNYFEVKNGIKVRKELLFTHKIDDNFKPFLLGKNININSITFDNTYIHYLPENEKLYTNQAFRSKEIFEQNKLIIRQILGRRIITTFDAECYYTDQTTYIVIQKDSLLDLKYLLSLINSKLMYYYFKNTLSDNKVTFPKVKRSHILEFPIKAISKEAQLPFINLADRMLSFNNELQGKSKRFINRTKVNFDLHKISTKLEKFYNFDFKTFVAELKKQKIKLSLVQQDDWEEYFNTYKSEINQLQYEIEKTDKEIDQMVYELYGLTEEEIKIVKGTTE